MVCRENIKEIYARGTLHKEQEAHHFAQSQQAEVWDPFWEQGKENWVTTET